MLGKARYKSFKTAEECRAWYVENHRNCGYCHITEITETSFERLVMLAQLERECEALGVAR